MTTVAETLDQHIRAIESIRVPDGKWHPSSLFTCARQAVYEMAGVQPSNPKDMRNRRILRQGSNLHEFVQEAYTQEAKALSVYHEVELTAPNGIYGHCDTLLEISPDEWELLEFKSKGGQAMKYAKELPSDEHVKQAKTYADILIRYGGRILNDDYPGGERDIYIPPLGDRLKRIRLAYFSRDDFEVKEFVSERGHDFTNDFDFPDQAFSAWLDNYVGSLSDLAGTDELPARLVAKQSDHWLCKSYCQFRTLCWKGES